jgi:predicted HTH domain antitoxin
MIEAYNLDEKRLKRFYEEILIFSAIALAIMVLGIGSMIIYGDITGIFISMIVNALLLGATGIVLLYSKGKDYLRVRRETPKVIEAIALYESGETSMIRAIATTELSIKEFMGVLKRENINVEFNDLALENF